MIYLLDSNHAVALLNSDPRMTNRLPQERLAGNEFGITTVPLGELYFGAYDSQQGPSNLARIHNLILPNFIIYEFTVAAAEEFGKIRAELRAKGRPIPTADVQIAAIARLHGLTLLTCDAHFSHVDGLRVENWLT